MKFQFRQSGCRFFFITISTAGHQPLLSRLVRGVKRPMLTPYGEQVKRIWTTLNAVDNHLIPSDYIIMPDHLHLLLIVNSSTEYLFSPLVFSHWFMVASSSSLPRIAKPASWGKFYSPSEWPTTAQGYVQLFAWEPRIWVEFIWSGRQLSSVRRYIRMNPERYFWKLDNPDMFVRRAIVSHSRLSPDYPWTACGDLTLLASPFLYHVRLSMSKSLAELEATIGTYIELAARGCIPVSGFLSPGEREFERRLKELAHSRWIKTVPYAVPNRFDPSVEDSQYLAAHRELILSSFTEDEAPPFCIRRDNCLAMNERIAEMIRKGK